MNRLFFHIHPLFIIGYLSTFLIPVCTPTVSINKGTIKEISLPVGFHIEVFKENVKNARSMCLGENGTIFIGTRGKGKVYALTYDPLTLQSDSLYTLAEELYMPNGVAFREGALYVAEVNRILRYDDIESQLSDPPPPVVVFDSLPDEKHHGWKYISFGPDDKLYIPVGAPCNICDNVEEPIYASIASMDPDGSNLEIFAQGVRNSVGFDWHPDTKELWFTDNGRDWLGDDAPNDELNYAPQKGMHFGYPYCHAGYLLDPEFGAGKKCEDYSAPAQKLGPHVAALGIKFYTGKMFPDSYKKKAFICEHGSWNRSEPSGYRITTVEIDKNKAVKYEVFAEGWLKGKSAWGRPVALLQMPDGSLLISDDSGDKIYRVYYSN